MITVTERALIQRINRKLRRRTDARLRISKGRYWRAQMGALYVFDTRRNCAIETHVNLEALARRLGALAPAECLLRNDGGVA